MSKCAYAGLQDKETHDEAFGIFNLDSVESGPSLLPGDSRLTGSPRMPLSTTDCLANLHDPQKSTRRTCDGVNNGDTVASIPSLRDFDIAAEEGEGTTWIAVTASRLGCCTGCSNRCRGQSIPRQVITSKWLRNESEDMTRKSLWSKRSTSFRPTWYWSSLGRGVVCMAERH